MDATRAAAVPTEQSESYTVPLSSLSGILQRLDWPVVDLLKLDVEGDELLALQGVSPCDWSRIRQVSHSSLTEYHKWHTHVTSLFVFQGLCAYCSR